MTSTKPYIEKVAQVLATRAGEGPQKKGESWFWREESRRKWIGIANAAYVLFQVEAQNGALADMRKELASAKARTAELEASIDSLQEQLRYEGGEEK